MLSLRSESGLWSNETSIYTQSLHPATCRWNSLWTQLLEITFTFCIKQINLRVAWFMASSTCLQMGKNNWKSVRTCTPLLEMIKPFVFGLMTEYLSLDTINSQPLCFICQSMTLPGTTVCPCQSLTKLLSCGAIYKSPVATDALTMGKAQTRTQEQNMQNPTVSNNCPRRKHHYLLMTGNNFTWVPGELSSTATRLYVHLDSIEVWSSSREWNLGILFRKEKQSW